MIRVSFYVVWKWGRFLVGLDLHIRSCVTLLLLLLLRILGFVLLLLLVVGRVDGGDLEGVSLDGERVFGVV